MPIYKKATAYTRKRAANNKAAAMAKLSARSHYGNSMGNSRYGANPGYAQIATVVRGMGLKGETKALDVPYGTVGFLAGNSASITLNATQEGAGFWNRIGRKICMKTLNLTGYIFPTGAVGALTEEFLRVIIAYDKQPNGVAATYDQVVQAYDNAGGITNSAFDGFNLDNRDRFIILRDRKVTMPRTAATGIPVGPPYGTSAGSVGTTDSGSDAGGIWKDFIKLDNYEVQYNGTANPATIGQINTGNLFILLQGSVGGQYSLGLTSRLRFTDC
nr:MAG: capsid protein [Cressdnaviricota sp.]